MKRIAKLQELLAGEGVSACLLSLGADLPYFTGYHAMPLERLTMAVVPAEGEAVLVVPELEAPRVVPRPDEFRIRPWGETEDPVEVVVDHLPERDGRVAVGDQTWAVFVLRMQAVLAQARFESATPLTRLLRMRKDDAEVKALRAAGESADRVAVRLRDIEWAGRSERDVSTQIGRMLREEGHDRVEFAIVASGPNGASPHHEPTDRVIESGDVVVCDFGGRVDDYCSDTTRCFAVGDVDHEVARAWDVLQAAQQAAFETARPGIAAQDVDRAARRVIADAGFGKHFVHRTGHGIGTETHEHPYIVEGNKEPLDEGMAFSIEPGIYVAGRFGIRLEDIVVLTADGAERLNNSPRDLAVVR